MNEHPVSLGINGTHFGDHWSSQYGEVLLILYKDVCLTLITEWIIHTTP
jgi:hypothetical protein